MNVSNVVKPSNTILNFKILKEFILERSPTKVMDIIKPIHDTVISKHIKAHIQERNPMNVSNM